MPHASERDRVVGAIDRQIIEAKRCPAGCAPAKCEVVERLERLRAVVKSILRDQKRS